jgi:hypothetical protein
MVDEVLIKAKIKGSPSGAKLKDGIFDYNAVVPAAHELL